MSLKSCQINKTNKCLQLPKHEDVDGWKPNLQLHKYWTIGNLNNMHKYEVHVPSIVLSQG